MSRKIIFLTLFLFIVGAIFISSCLKGNNLRTYENNYLVHISYLNFTEERDYFELQGWAFVVENLLKDDYRICSVWFDGIELSFRGAPWPYTMDRNIVYSMLPELSISEGYEVLIETDAFDIKRYVQLPYQFTNVNFPEYYDFTEPFTLKWTMVGSNTTYEIRRRVDGHNSFSNCEGGCFYKTISSQKTEYEMPPITRIVENSVELSIRTYNQYPINGMTFYINTGNYVKAVYDVDGNRK